MKSSIKLAEALERTAERVEKDRDYDWSYPQSCNCGILAQELLGVNQEDLKTIIHGDANLVGSWSLSAEDVMKCAVTGAPLVGVFRALKECGIDLDDFWWLEEGDKVFDHHNDTTNRMKTANLFRSKAAEMREDLKDQQNNKPQLVATCPPMTIPFRPLDERKAEATRGKQIEQQTPTLV